MAEAPTIRELQREGLEGNGSRLLGVRSGLAWTICIFQQAFTRTFDDMMITYIYT